MPDPILEAQKLRKLLVEFTARIPVVGIGEARNELEEKLEALIAADKERAVLDKEEMTFRYAIQTLTGTSKDFAIENLNRQLEKNLYNQELQSHKEKEKES